MKASAGGFVVDLEEPTYDNKATTKENVAGLRLEDTPILIGDCGLVNPACVDDSDIREQYEAFLTDPRRI